MSSDVSTPSNADESQPAARRRSRLRLLVTVLLLYVLAAYLVVPFVWKRYAHHHPSFDDNPRITETGDGHPGGPLNVALIGSETGIQNIMHAAGWYPAAALGLESDLRIADDTVFSRPDDQAPVSSLYLFGRKEDLAFEQPVGDNPRQRNHVRFWKTPHTDSNGRLIWIGAASYDERVGLSHTTGQITHHIAADVDKERDHLFADLQQTDDLSDFYQIDHFQTTTEGRNGGGDKWYTDGALFVGVLKGTATSKTK